MKRKERKHYTTKNSLTKRKGTLWALRDRLDRIKNLDDPNPVNQERNQKRKLNIIKRIASLVQGGDRRE